MKNKKLTYFLLLLVTVVWGLIIYRVVAAAGNDDSQEVAAVAPPKEAYNDYSLPKDTSHLLLNYRDPFALIVLKDTSKVLIKQKRVSGIGKKQAINWNFVKYSGFMQNPGSKKLIAILTINGKTVNMSEGETIDKVKLLQNKRDSVKVLFNGRTKFIADH